VIKRVHGVWCPLLQSGPAGAAAALPAITAPDAQLISISPQTALNSGKSERENKVTFPLLSDPGTAVAARFGLRFRLPAGNPEDAEDRRDWRRRATDVIRFTH
jgi:peroxiredoxin